MSSRPYVIAVVNQKGGVGKTTTAVNLAACLAAAERRTLLIDLDPQGNATSAYGIHRPERQIYDALIEDLPLGDCAVPTELDTLSVVPSGKDLVGAEIELVHRDGREYRLARVLEPLGDRYDLVLVDCPPSLGLLTLNALSAADAVLIPLQCEYYALEGLASLVETIELVRERLNPRLCIQGIVLTMVDQRNNLARQVESEVRRHFGDLVYRTRIPRNVRLSEAPSHGQPILLYDIHSKGAVAYTKLAEELLAQLAGHDPRRESTAGFDGDPSERAAAAPGGDPSERAAAAYGDPRAPSSSPPADPRADRHPDSSHASRPEPDPDRGA